jgi:hypothetical protein
VKIAQALVRLKLFIIALFLGAYICVPSPAYASGISVNPARLNFAVSSKNPVNETKIQIKNNEPKTVQLIVELVSVDPVTQVPDILTRPSPDLLSSVKFSKTEISIPAGKTESVGIQARDTKELAPGGHGFAVILRQSGQKTAGVGLQSAVALQGYIVKEDGAKKELMADLPQRRGVRFSLPAELTTSIKNVGNVIVIPRAQTRLLKGDTSLSTAVVNQESIAVSPGQELKLQAQYQNPPLTFLPFRVTEQLAYRFDGSDEIKIAQKSFWVIPWQGLIIGLVFLGVLLLAIKKITKRKRRVKSSKHVLKKPHIIHDIAPPSRKR